jgi:hypothetical protein
VSEYDLAHDEQTEAEALAFTSEVHVRKAAQRLEQRVKAFLWNARTGVLDRQVTWASSPCRFTRMMPPWSKHLAQDITRRQRSPNPHDSRRR